MVDVSRETIDWYLGTLAQMRKDKPPRKYDHPVAIIGGGMGGVSTALDMLRRDRPDFIIFEQDSNWGGATWNEVANKTTKLQTEKGTYHAEFLDMLEPVDPVLLTWPPRDTLRDMLNRAVKKHGLDDKAKLSCAVQKINKVGDPLKGGHYEIKTEGADGDGKQETCKVSAVVSCPGVFYNPVDIKLQGKESFDGYITHGSYDQLRTEKLKGQEICIIGHGGFTIENVRTCVEYGGKMINIVCRNRHLSGPKMTSWLVSGLEAPVPGHVLVKSFQVMYDLIGYDVWKHPTVKTDEKRTMAMIQQSTTFGVTDVYFLAFAYGLVKIFQTEIEKLSKHKVHCKNKDEFDCTVILKCLGSVPDPDWDDIANIKELTGYWINREPLNACLAMAKGVAAKNFGSFSVGPFFAGAITTVNYFIDYPEEALPILEQLPPNVKDGSTPAYYAKGSYMLACGSIIGKHQALSWQLSAMDRLKARKTQEAHPLEAHLAEVNKEWSYYIQLMKDQGQIEQDAPLIPYPYTTEIMHEHIKESYEYWATHALGKKS